MDGDKYLRSSTEECHTPPWIKFANKNKVAILGLGFLFDERDWPIKKSYQFPHAWSGAAVNQILGDLELDNPIDKNQLYLYGVSGGAQFSVRYAFYNPSAVKGVAVHAAGSYDPPLEYIPTMFLITVGEQDSGEIPRKEMAEEFAAALALFEVDHELVIVDDIGHVQTEEQNEMSRRFIRKLLSQVRRAHSSEVTASRMASLPIGLEAEQVFNIFPVQKAWTHRYQGSERFLSYLYGPQQQDFLTVHLKNGVLYNWALNARHEIVDEYLTEFLSGGVLRSYPKTFKAIRNALMKLPQEPFMKVIDRRRPVIFLDVTTGGIAQYANATDFYFREGDPPAFSKGFYLIKLGRGLEDADSLEEIEGIIFHELTHHVLDHLRGPVDCDTEREANRLVKEWGFAAELAQASERFGAKKPEDSPCYEGGRSSDK